LFFKYNLLLKGVVFVDGEFWSEQRKFATRHLRNLGLSGNALENIILQEVDALVKELNQKCSSQTKVNARIM